MNPYEIHPPLVVHIFFELFSVAMVMPFDGQNGSKSIDFELYTHGKASTMPIQH